MGGGILIAVSSSLSSSIIPLPEDNIEQMAVLVSYPSKFLLVCSYITPASPIELYHQHLANIRTLIGKYQDIPLCFLGDLNLPDVDWNPSYDPLLIPLSSLTLIRVAPFAMRSLT